MFSKLGDTFPQTAHVGLKDDDSKVILVLRSLEMLSDLSRAEQLLFEFPVKRLLRCFPKFDLAAWELPQAGQRHSLAALRCEDGFSVD